jgi:membrane-bound serine protease (ClpP class)
MLLGASLLAMQAFAQEAQTGADRPVVHIAPLTGVIGPANSAFIEDVIGRAQGEADAVILEMDTPGGLVTSMRDINEVILNSEVPVIVYVHPDGARATSAGAYILYASHLAAMAPGTTIGAATPVEMGGTPGTPQEDPGNPDTPATPDGETQPDATPDAPSSDQAMRNKVVNDSVASIRSLAERHGRNADWAERAVREGVSLTASGAFEQGVVEILADDVEDLLAQADGRVVVMVGGDTLALTTANAELVEVQPGLANRILSVITDPNIAFLLINIGFIGLLASFYNGLEPVTLLAGLLCLILGFYALNTLPVNYAGALLILFGLGFLIAEMFVTSYGLLALTGLVIFALGSLMLVDTDIDGLRLDWRLVVGVTVAMGALVLGVVGYGLAAQTRKVTTGREGLKGQYGEVLEWSGSEGFVHVEGERWSARSNDTLSAGDRIKVTGVIGLTLTVKKA